MKIVLRESWEGVFCAPDGEVRVNFPRPFLVFSVVPGREARVCGPHALVGRRYGTDDVRWVSGSGVTEVRLPDRFRRWR